MILDKENLFSDAQAVTATASSTNVLKLPKGLAKGEPVRLLCQVTETFATLTSLTVGVRTSATLSGANLSGPTTLVSTAAVPAASLVAGYQFTVEFMPSGTLDYVDLNYTVGGSNATAGKITAGIVFDRQTAR
jgi:hypothetical protein